MDVDEEHSESPPLRRYKVMPDRFDGDGDFGTYLLETFCDGKGVKSMSAKPCLSVSLVRRVWDVHFSLANDI